MKKLLFGLSAIVLIIVTNSCKKEDVNQLTEFDINYSNDVTIPSTSFTTVTAPVDISTPEFATNISSSSSSNKTTIDLISEIKLTRFNISTTNANLDFLQEITIFIKATGLGETQIASKTNIPSGITSIAADIKDVNIKDYITKEKISLRASMKFKTGSSNSINMKLDETVHVKATILK